MAVRRSGLPEPPAYEEIVGRILDRLREGAGISETAPGSVARTLAEAFALEVVNLHERLRAAYEMGFVDTAEGAALDQVVALLGIERRGPRFAVGNVVFSRVAPVHAVTIPAGTRLSCLPGQDGSDDEESLSDARRGDDDEDAEDPARAPGGPGFGEDPPPVGTPGLASMSSPIYETTIAAKISRGVTEIEVPVRALVAGPAGVVEAGRICRLDSPFIGVDDVHNPSPTILGGDAEGDAELRARTMSVMLSAGRSTVEGLRSAALSVSGVSGVSVRESPHGVAGEVELVVDGVDPGEAATMERLRAAVEPRRPAGIKIAISGVRLVLLRVELTVSLRDGANEAEAVESIREAVRREVARLPPGGAVQRNRLIAAILGLPEVREVEDIWIRSRALDPEAGAWVDETRARERGDDIDVGAHERASVDSVEVHTQWSPREYAPVLVTANVVATLESLSVRPESVRDRLAAAIDSYVTQMRRGEPLDYARLRTIARNTPGVVDILDLALDAFYEENSIRVEGLREDLRLAPEQRARPGEVRLEIVK